MLNDLFTQVVLITGVSVMAVQQILKLKFIPTNITNTYPVLAAIVLSIVGTILAITVTPLAAPATLLQWAAMTVEVLLVATGTYFFTIRNWSQLRSMEG